MFRTEDSPARLPNQRDRNSDSISQEDEDDEDDEQDHSGDDSKPEPGLLQVHVVLNARAHLHVVPFLLLLAQFGVLVKGIASG